MSEGIFLNALFLDNLLCGDGIELVETNKKMTARTNAFMTVVQQASRTNTLPLIDEMFATDRQKHPKLQGFSNHLMEKENLDFFRNMRLTKETFSCLQKRLEKRHCPEHLGGFYPISAGVVLQLTLWYLGNKSTYREMAEQFGLSEAAVFQSVQKGILFLCDLAKDYIKWPSHEESKKIEKSFSAMVGFPGVIGAIDGSHIQVKAPADVQADFINRTQRHSVNLMAVCDADKNFTFISAGYPGSAHDSRVFKSTDLFQLMENNADLLFASNFYHIIGDSAFQLSNKLLVPFKDYGKLTPEQSKYNTKLSQTRCVIENAFGFLKGRFRRLKYLDCDVKRVPNIIKACCVLHNVCLQFPNEEKFLLAEGEIQLHDGQSKEIADDIIRLPEDIRGLEKRNFLASLL